MTALIREKGDLLLMADAGEFDIIIHGCNCFNTMGAGIARQIADRYPKAKDADDITVRGDITKLGNYSYGWHIREDITALVIFNAYTQYSTSKAGEDVFEYDAFKLILRKIAHEVSGFQKTDVNIGLPYIGMGLAGGDAKRILQIMEDFAESIAKLGGTVTLVEYAP